MQYQIVRRQSGFLRLRLGKYVFTKEQGYGLSTLLLAHSGVREVHTNHLNGGIQITYDGDIEAELLQRLATLRQADLVDGALDTRLQREALDREFRTKLIQKIAWRLARKAFLPTLAYNAFVCWRARHFLMLGMRALRHRRMSVEVLDAAAIGVSLGAGQFGTASSIMFLLSLSDLLLEYSNARAKQALASSLSVQISRVWLVEDGIEHSIPMEELQVGDTIRVRAGSMIPVDGTVKQGDALVNEATMTGEPLSVHKTVGKSVYAGTVVETGEVDITVRALSDDSRIAKIIELIDSGEETKAQMQGKAERLADGIVPISLGLCLATLALTRSVARATSVLMVDFSCAIKLTTPISIISALHEGAKKQMVIKGGKYMELLANADTVVFDKTGTLTNAVPKVSRIIPMAEGYTAQEVLKIAACLEEHFPHSVAAAIVAEAEAQGLHHPEEHEKVEYVVAHGIASGYRGRRAIIGSRHFVFEDEQVPLPVEGMDWMDEQIGADSSVFLAIDHVLVGVICVNDPPRTDAKATVEALRELGMKEIIMITGDSEATAKHISEELGLDRYFATVLPDGKAALISQLKAEGKTVLMVGDGINDTPALSCADVSMTLNGSSDIAREVSDIAILSDELDKIVVARRLSTSLMGRIAQNYQFIVAFNTALILCGMAGILPATSTAWLHNTSTVALAIASARPLLPPSTHAHASEPNAEG